MDFDFHLRPILRVHQELLDRDREIQQPALDFILLFPLVDVDEH
jgi:hypothetical protein